MKWDEVRAGLLGSSLGGMVEGNGWFMGPGQAEKAEG